MFEALATLVVYELLGIAPASRLVSALHFVVMDVVKIFVLLVLLAVVIYVVGLLQAMLTPEGVREFVRGRPDW